MLEEYPVVVRTKGQRYQFEHGLNSIWKMCLDRGDKVMMATFDGEYEWFDWRKGSNIYRRGDQSNCLTMFRHTSRFRDAPPANKVIMERLADTLEDETFLRMMEQRDANYAAPLASI